MSIFVFLCVAESRSQVSVHAQAARVDSILQVLLLDKEMEARTKSDLADSAFRISVRIDDVCRQINARIYQAASLDFIGMADSALTQLFWARAAFRAPCDSLLLFDIYANMTNSFLSLEEVNRVDSISQIALKMWNPNWKNKEFRFTILNHLAISQFFRQDTAKGTQTFRQLYREALAANDKNNVRSALINLGTIKGLTGDLDSAYYFFTSAAEPSLLHDDIIAYLDLQYNLAHIDIERKRYKQAAERLDSVFALAEKRENLAMMASVQDARAQIFAHTLDFKKAYTYLREYNSLRESALNEERVKAVTEMMEKYESEKKARQIQELEVKNLDVTLSNERIRNTRNRYMFIGAGVLLLAIGLYSRLHYVRKSRAAIEKEKNISEGLLLNILPASVAEELKVKGHAEAKHYDEATILFSDFKSFTTIAGEMNATDLVNEINDCFKAFDEIMAVHGLEKIKTIGDSYMAAGAIPDTNKATALDVVNAGLTMQQFIKTRKAEREARRLPAFEMRVGIHTGPVVAGIVGVKKFQYDLWGDTVNIASRMETNSEPGYVNISATTYQLLKDEPSLSFTPRGMMHVKGKGEMEMYFVDVRDKGHGA